MNIGIIGTGMVGEALATKLVQLGHAVKMGARSATNEKAAAWVKNASGNAKGASHGTFAEAASFGEVVLNCTSGAVSLEALQAAGPEALRGKILIDVANPLGAPDHGLPILGLAGKDSLGEQIQRAFPETRVVKTLNTINVDVMVNPRAIAGGDHALFLCGNDAAAKASVRELLATFGWKEFIDLGDITAARGTESYLPLWLRLMKSLGTAAFNIKVVR
ncbi:NAD(P)-binding domain-containing protein [Pendulispora rubella]|uniref:NAD(P)-binding domain-containing protein n=1 Tax=Pendulispora rubella TaxID=2741070 RepID=A0ABZ2LJE6_9BACT